MNREALTQLLALQLCIVVGCVALNVEATPMFVPPN